VLAALGHEFGSERPNYVVDGGAGANTVSYAGAGTGVTVNLALQGQAQYSGVGTDILSHFQNLTGSAYADHLSGDSGDNVIDGGGGNDVLDGGAGFNAVSYASASEGVSVNLGMQGQAQNTVGAGTDILYNFQALIGSAYADVLEGGGSLVPPGPVSVEAPEAEGVMKRTCELAWLNSVA